MKTVSALRAIKQGILICDKNSRIYYFNKAYEDYIGVSLKVAQGRPLVEFRSGARAPEVIETGVPIEGIYRKEHGQEYFASIYPIKEEDNIIGSISIVTSVGLSKKQIEEQGGTLAERVRMYERSVIENMMLVYGSDVAAKKKIARELGISLATLYNKLAE